MIRSLVLTAIKIFQLTRVLRAPACRFYPSCSDYAHTAITSHGLGRGMGLTMRRLLKCHPWHSGGVDFVPAEY